MKHIAKIILPGLILLFSWACNKDYNEEVDVDFYCASKSQFYGNSLTTIDQDNIVISINANGISNTTAETLADSMLLISNDFTAITGVTTYYYVEGRASGLVVYPGDSTYHYYSRRWEDYPLSEGESIVLDNNVDNALHELLRGYFGWGTYTTYFIGSNYYDPDSDPKEKVVSVNVDVYPIDDVEDFYYNVVPDTNALKARLGVSDTLGFEGVFTALYGGMPDPTYYD
jgi:hypothetical protein